MRDNFYWADETAKTILSRGYIPDGQTVEERVRVIADTAEKINGIEGFADKFFGYMARGYYSLSSPVWSNFGTDRGFPVSCFGSMIEDTTSSIMYTHGEVGMLSKFGGGTSGFLGKLRPRGAEIVGNGESNGSVAFLQMFDTLTDVISQGSVRRGFFTPYLNIDHGDFDEFVGIGSDGHPIQTLTSAVTVSNEFIEDMLNGNEEKQRRWALLLKNRSETGFPYIFFEDNVNDQRPEVYKDKNMKVYASNMCSEIALPSNKDESFICVLSSMNIAHYDEWKETDAVETLTIFLDTVVSEFVEKLEDQENEDVKYFLKRVLKFAKGHRALGLGVLGWHSYLQSKMIPFESREAAKLNLEIFKFLNKKTLEASQWMAKEWGEPEVLEGYGRRNTTLMAVAPTKTSSAILGCISPSIEPEFSNYYVKGTSKVEILKKNPYLERVLDNYNQNIPEIWQMIEEADGSVQHLDFLTDHEKEVFKTIYEINPEAIVDQAAVRTPYIDQAQSINLMISPDMPPREIHQLYLRAWQSGVKTLYYQYSLNAAQSAARKKIMSEGCTACEG